MSPEAATAPALAWLDRPPLRVRQNKRGHGYWFGEDLVPDYRDDPRLDRNERLRVAVWAVCRTPLMATSEQFELARTLTRKPLKWTDGWWSRECPEIYALDPVARAVVGEPGRHPALRGVEYALTAEQLGTLVGVPVTTLRRWEHEGTITSPHFPDTDDEFGAPATACALARASREGLWTPPDRLLEPSPWGLAVPR
ncbi:MAG TPA: hypothetical protein VN238_08600 [Solirubrobacteraceae bacterium]|nr:hypothetical protein [Solirubrobacteraceae bacterium]